MKKILIGTDGSEVGSAAVDVALDLAADEGAEVVFVHVVSVLDFAPHLDEKAELPPQRMPRPEADLVLREAIELAESRGVTATGELLIGYPPTQIVRLAREIDADLIVVGSRDLGRVKSAVLGSTSREVLAHADRPVLVVRDSAVREPIPA
jgi:nucleotide-binding universal stress UspA family protein